MAKLTKREALSVRFYRRWSVFGEDRRPANRLCITESVRTHWDSTLQTMYWQTSDCRMNHSEWSVTKRLSWIEHYEFRCQIIRAASKEQPEDGERILVVRFFCSIFDDSISQIGLDTEQTFRTNGTSNRSLRWRKRSIGNLKICLANTIWLALKMRLDELILRAKVLSYRELFERCSVRLGL